MLLARRAGTFSERRDGEGQVRTTLSDVDTVAAPPLTEAVAQPWPETM